MCEEVCPCVSKWSWGGEGVGWCRCSRCLHMGCQGELWTWVPGICALCADAGHHVVVAWLCHVQALLSWQQGSKAIQSARCNSATCKSLLYISGVRLHLVYTW